LPLSNNPNAIDIIEKNLKIIVKRELGNLSQNPAAIKLLEKIKKKEWDWLSMNPAIFEVA